MKKLKALIIGLLLLVVIGFLPYETSSVPAWKMRIVDEYENPYGQLKATQVWKDYNLEIGIQEHEEIRYTDQNGYVTFPERRLKASLLWRIVSASVSFLLKLAHGGSGVHAYVFANGPDGYADVRYIPGAPPPNKLVLQTAH